jgi:hypothetical protein
VAQEDRRGIQVNASGAENAFTVDGIVTNSLVNGASRQNTVFEYLQEVQVKTSGISAEYGGALGGVVSAVTKSGGNVFHGEGHYYFEGSSLFAAPVKRLVLDPLTEKTAFYVQDQECECVNEFGGRSAGPSSGPAVLLRGLHRKVSAAQLCSRMAPAKYSVTSGFSRVRVDHAARRLTNCRA